MFDSCSQEQALSELFRRCKDLEEDVAKSEETYKEKYKEIYKKEYKKDKEKYEEKNKEKNEEKNKEKNEEIEALREALVAQEHRWLAREKEVAAVAVAVAAAVAVEAAAAEKAAEKAAETADAWSLERGQYEHVLQTQAVQLRCVVSFFVFLFFCLFWPYL